MTALLVMFTGCNNDREKFDMSGDCNIIALTLNSIKGVGSDKDKTFTFTVKQGYDLTEMKVEQLEISAGATIDLAVGDLLNMAAPRCVTVTNGDARQQWTLRAEYEEIPVEKPLALYVGLAATRAQLNIEEQTACLWLIENYERATYSSLADIAKGKTDLSECKIIWWHLHQDGGIDGKAKFEAAAPDAMAAANRLKSYYRQGGAFLLTRYATYLPAYLGENAVYPNNCWGGEEDKPELVNTPWSFFDTNHTDHPLFASLLMNSGEEDKIYTCDTGYGITNSTAQWHIGTDWGGYADYTEWRTASGATDIAYGGDGAIVAWEYPATTEHGGIICIGSGCYDWYSALSYVENWHANVAKMTTNAINYLTK